MNTMPSRCSSLRVQLLPLSGAAQACSRISLQSQAPVGGGAEGVSAPTPTYPTGTKFMFSFHPDDSWGNPGAGELPRRPGWSPFSSS